MYRRASVFAAIICLGGPASAQDFNATPPNATDQTPAFEQQTRAPILEDGFSLETTAVAEGLEHPWGMAELPDGSWLVTERPGRMRLWRPGSGLSEPIEGLPDVDGRGQGGLLDVVVGDDFAETRQLWFSFSQDRPLWRSIVQDQRRDRANRTAVGTGILSEDGTSIEDMRVIFEQEPFIHSQSHFGSRLVLDGQGALFVTTGDRASPETEAMVQLVDNHIGKVVRIALDGGPAEGNPVIEGGLPEIWSIGHRNLQSAALGPDGALWTVEHGPRGGDELNRPEAGKNYGWPVISYGINYSGEPLAGAGTEQDGMEQPVYYWDPVIAPSGMAFYDGEMFPEWQGDALIGGLAAMTLVRLHLTDGQVTGEARYLQDMARIRDVEVASDGAIMLLTDDPEGQLLRVTRGE
ncbi:PQQ-dependent sugar dehydrogenase [Paracoccus tegillarcae]|uniref:Glucose dehydrogenase n=1 Tax=Paracoccus tegillarcae TaxID=1529068 RepID=A0A2K9EEW3_9RHOB|nr:PQQ-dependent sugar dehydrogenase [Paracoccus tegillarcae]AUH33500.1 glucose dehydrogenase [Paracoccus tegillarcae]